MTLAVSPVRASAGGPGPEARGLRANLTGLHATVVPLEGTRLWLTDRAEDRLPLFYSPAIDCKCGRLWVA